MKSTILFFTIVGVLFAAGCGGARVSGGQRETSGLHLDQFAGAWQATYDLIDAGSVTVSSGTLTVKQPSADIITFAESLSMVTAAGPFGAHTDTKRFNVSLKEDSSRRYLLSFNVNGQTLLQDFPLSYSEAEGFAGQNTVSIDGKNQQIAASIKRDGEGYDWKITAVGASPKREYEFKLKEKEGSGKKGATNE